MKHNDVMREVAKAKAIGLRGDIAAAYAMMEKLEKKHHSDYEVLFLHATLAAMLNKHEIAERSALRAFQLNRQSYDAALLLTKISVNTLNHPQAMEYAKIACELRPMAKDAVIYYAVELYRVGDTEAAEKMLLELYQRDNQDVDVASLLGMVWANAGYTKQALALFANFDFMTISKVDVLSRFYEVLIANGEALKARECVQRCITLLEQGKASVVTLAAAWGDLGATYMLANETEQAMQLFDKALALDPKSKQTLLNKAALHKALEQYREAIACYQTAVKYYPADHKIYHNLNNLLREMGFLQESLRYGQIAVELRPGNASYVANLGATYFGMGQLADAWPLYEMRLNEVSGTFHDLALPIWQGEPLHGKRLLIVREQGIGDELLFATMFADLPQDAEEIGFACHYKLQTLLQRTFPHLTIFRADQCDVDALRAHYDYVISMASLGKFYRQSLSDFQGKHLSLVLDPIKTEASKHRLAALPPGLRIAFSWRSLLRGLHRNPHYPDHLAYWQLLFDLPGIQWVCTQYGITEEEQRELEQRLGDRLHLFADVDHFDDLESSAALLAACDLVLAPCTATAVLAACVDRPVLRIVYGLDIFMHGTDCYPWLPMVHPVVRAFDEPWESVFSRLRDILQGLSAH